MLSQRITMMRQQFFILLASMVVVLSGTIAYFAYHNLTYDRARTRQIRHAGFVEKQAVLPDKSVIIMARDPTTAFRCCSSTSAGVVAVTRRCSPNYPAATMCLRWIAMGTAAPVRTRKNTPRGQTATILCGLSIMW